MDNGQWTIRVSPTATNGIIGNAATVIVNFQLSIVHSLYHRVCLFTRKFLSFTFWGKTIYKMFTANGKNVL